MRRTDEELLQAACGGEDGAFHELVDRHGERLFHLACSLVGAPADAEDVVQETLMGAYRGMRSFEGRSTVKTWLTRILMRQAARWHRRRGRRRDEGRLSDSGPPVGAADSVAEDSNRRRDVRRALDRLSAKHRRIVVLREFEGMSYAEIAEVLDVPKGTVESRLYRARRRLQAMLRDYL